MPSSASLSDRAVLAAVLGPTAVGKSAAAVALAERFDGEIVNCDSMQVYRGFDIGTDKPGREERARVPHHLLDIVDGRTQFTAADFAVRAAEAVRAIARRGRLPLVVGGTGLYFRALFEGLFPGPGRDAAVRAALEAEVRAAGPEALWERLQAVDPEYAAKVGRRDAVRIVRALEVETLTGIPLSVHFRGTAGYLPDFRAVKIGLRLESGALARRIEERVDRMFAQGLVEEVRGLLRGGLEESAPPFKALGYRQVLRALRGEISVEEAVRLTKIDTRHYAKRQMTWFRKSEGIAWFSPDDLEAAAAHIASQMSPP